VLVIDEQVLIRMAMSAVVGSQADMTCVGAVAGGTVGIRLVGEADVVVTELEFSSESGFELVRRLRERSPVLGIVVHSGLATGAFVGHCLSLGADAFVEKGTDVETLMLAIRRAAAGNRYVGPGLGGRVRDHLEGRRSAGADPADALSAGELQVLQKMSLGMTTAETALSLGKCAKTIATFQSRIRRKVGLANLEQLIRFAVLHFSRAARA